MATAHDTRTGLLRACLFAATVGACLAGAQEHGDAASLVTPMGPARFQGQASSPQAPLWIPIRYTAHDGRTRGAIVLLPHRYGPRDNPAIPLVIAPHGRGHTGAMDAPRYGDLPSIGNFAVVSPDGEGRRLHRYSWGAPGQISDLAHMADIVESALPWVHIDRSRQYAIGGSMGGQETLLLVGEYPHLLAGAAAVDGVADFPLQYRNYPQLPCKAKCRARIGNIGRYMQGLAVREVGGTPESVPDLYAERSPLTYSGAIASSCTRLQIWWSREDKVVMDAAQQSGRMFETLRQVNPHAPIDEYVGAWPHTRALRARYDLPVMLAGLGLLPNSFSVERLGAEHSTIPGTGCTSR
jgi:pimeloyl-ACP methyl ester carboxylesterase